MLDPQYDTARQQIDAVDPSTRLVVIHPNYLRHRLLLDSLLKQDNAVYIRFDGNALNTADLRSQMASALDVQTGQPDLNGSTRLVLDECDRAEADAFDQFLGEIVDHVSQTENSRITVISRVTPQYILSNEDAHRVAHFVPVDEGLMLCNYAREEKKPALLEVQSFGTGRVLLNGIEIGAWDGVLPRSLFFYLVDRGMTTRNEIFDTFWPKLTTREATNVFHVTKRKISEVLGMDLTVYWSGFYRISPDIHLVYDAMEFTRLVQESAIAPPDEAEAQLVRASTLYRGPFLTSLTLEWAENRRQDLLQTYGEVLVSLAKASEKANEKGQALGRYVRAAQTNPTREDLVQSIMTLYDEMGHYDDALTAYDRLVDALKTELELAPAPQLQELAESIREKTHHT